MFVDLVFSGIRLVLFQKRWHFRKGIEKQNKGSEKIHCQTLNLSTKTILVNYLHASSTHTHLVYYPRRQFCVTPFIHYQRNDRKSSPSNCTFLKWKTTNHYFYAQCIFLVMQSTRSPSHDGQHFATRIKPFTEFGKRVYDENQMFHIMFGPWKNPQKFPETLKNCLIFI